MFKIKGIDQTSNLAFSSVNGLSTNPTLTLAKAPAMRFPCEDSLGSTEWLFRPRSCLIAKKGIVVICPLMPCKT